MASSQEVLWLLQAQSGDCHALDNLLRGIQRQLYGYLVSLVHDEHMAEDLLQDVLVIVTQKLRWLREPSAFSAWVYRIASRQAFRALRTRERVASFHETDPRLEAEAEAPEETPPPEILDRIPELLEE